MLKEIKELEGFGDSVVKVAEVFALVMAVPQQKKHLALWCKKGVRASMEAGNYGVAAHMIRRAEVEEDYASELADCEGDEHAGANTAPHAAQLTSEDVAFCWETFSLLEPDAPATSCTYCPATFGPSSVIETNTQCTYCSYGVTE